MLNLVALWLLAIRDFLHAIFIYIFPEFPDAGVGVVVVVVALLLFYLVKTGLANALRISLITGLGLIVILYTLHHLLKLVSVFHVF